MILNVRLNFESCSLTNFTSCDCFCWYSDVSLTCFKFGLLNWITLRQRFLNSSGPYLIHQRSKSHQDFSQTLWFSCFSHTFSWLYTMTQYSLSDETIPLNLRSFNGTRVITFCWCWDYDFWDFWIWANEVKI